MDCFAVSSDAPEQCATDVYHSCQGLQEQLAANAKMPEWPEGGTDLNALNRLAR
jgi:hypothetical protein